jgi:hypothetical protein
MKQGELVNAKASKMALNVVYSSMQDGYDQKWTMVYLGIIGTYLWENVKQLCDVIWPILDLFS